MDVDKILAVILEESRKMPGRDQRVNLDELRAKLDIKIGEVIDDLNRSKKARVMSSDLDAVYVGENGRPWK